MADSYLSKAAKLLRDCRMPDLRYWSRHVGKKLTHKDPDQVFHCKLLWQDPLVIHLGLNYPQDIWRYFQNESVTWLVKRTWTLEPEFQIKRYHDYLTSVKGKAPQHRWITLANTPKELENLHRYGLEATLANHNMFCDHERFQIDLSVNKVYRALYDGQISPYKRHELASQVEQLALICYRDNKLTDAEVAAICDSVGHATWINGAPPLHADYRYISYQDVARAINASHTGLALSEQEGAMFGCIQYLLCGVPVVTTPNIGGRDVFLTPDNSCYIDPTPEAVERGVAEMIERSPNREAIRETALAQMFEMRSHFIAFMNQLLGIDDYQAHFDAIFSHKLLDKASIRHLWQQIADARAKP